MLNFLKVIYSEHLCFKCVSYIVFKYILLHTVGLCLACKKINIWISIIYIYIYMYVYLIFCGFVFIEIIICNNELSGKYIFYSLAF